MGFAPTTHATERWAQLNDPPLSWAQAARELAEVARKGNLTAVGTTCKGQTVFRVDEPRLAFLVVKVGSDKRGRSYAYGNDTGVIVTVLSKELWDRETEDAVELLEIMETNQARQAKRSRSRR